MAINVEDKIEKMRAARREKFESRAAELLAEEMTLRELRKACKLAQIRVTKQLNIT